MARSANTDANARAAEAAAKDAASGADRQKADARLNAGFQMLQKAGDVALAAAMLGGKGAVLGLRGSIPLLELYTGTTRKLEHDSDGDGSGLEKLGLSRGEAGVVRKAFTKGMLEALEISSVTHPVYDGAPVYRSINSQGTQEPPQMVHFLALGAAAAAIWRRWDAAQDPPKPEPEPEGVIMVPLSQAIEPVAIRPGEYAAAPQTSAEIRRIAMRQRNLTQPRMAMLAYSGDPRSVVPVEARVMSLSQPMARRDLQTTSGSPRIDRDLSRGATTQGHSHSHGGGCGCRTTAKAGCGCGGGGGGGSACSCGGAAVHSFSPARYDEDGRCAGLFSVSCETRWRIRDCLKTSFCDLLRCMGDELCEREEGKKPDLGKCLEDFLCSFLQCLPDAICPPQDHCAPACPPKTIDACHCNFAVGE